ncbi:PspA/IM30 family protein [Exilibacterium tricleocarpae]|uniref:PspA/IM30 family protein n=1 Tax=Exilibacterium tricleocarpae TaxID=2591008 RepID=A0A545TFL0_9GAMM|nr:PspA/IM30 family protein [Exilibacterium tricleocarpae]TQV75985.1 PspA/IM30 family protein [Exilibacterium tricleocarpae]
MNIWAKMMTALRGGVNEAGEAIVDSQALRILDQEVRDASEELKQSKDSLAAIIARQKLSEEKVVKLNKEIETHEGYAVKALEKGDESLAREVAGKIADFENQSAAEAEAGAGYARSADQLRAAIKQAEANIKRLKQQVDTVKATENVQRAQEAVAERHSGSNSKLRTAMDSLERIKEKQSLKAAKMNAASELAAETSDATLQQKLEEAGIAPSGKSADDILERLKKKGA